MAGSFVEVLRWCSESGTNPHNVIYLYRQEQLNGLTDFKLIQLRNWLTNREYTDEFRELVYTKANWSNLNKPKRAERCFWW